MVTYAFQDAPVLVHSPMHTGLDADPFFLRGNDAALAPDQREEDVRTACFAFEVGEEAWALGRARARLRLTVGGAARAVVARLCDVPVDGSSPLSRGAC